MLTIIQQESRISEIRLPNRNLIRENNNVDIIIDALPKHFNAPPENRQRIMVLVFFNFNEFMYSEPYEIASVFSRIDFFTNRDVHLIELYRIVLSVAELLKAYILSKNIPYLLNEVFPLDPPDMIRAKLSPVLRKINKPQNDVLLNNGLF